MNISTVKRHNPVMTNENSRVSSAIQRRACCCGMWGSIHSHVLKMHFCCHKALPCPHCFLVFFFSTQPIKHFHNSETGKDKGGKEEGKLINETTH